MFVEADKSPQVLMWLAGVAVVLFSAIGIAGIMGWISIPVPTARATSFVEATVPATGNAVQPAASTPATSAR